MIWPAPFALDAFALGPSPEFQEVRGGLIGKFADDLPIEAWLYLDRSREIELFGARL